MQNHFATHLNDQMEVYDVGCGNKPFSDFLSGKVSKYLGVDIEDGFYDAGHIDIVGSAYDVPVDDEVADAVISSQVIEHLNKPIDAIKETSRILKPNGLFFLSFPFMYPMHATPHDYMRYTSFYMNDILKQHKLELIEEQKIGGFWYCTGMCFGLYIQSFDRGILKKIKIVKFIGWVVKWLFNLLHLLEGGVLTLLGKNRENSRENWTVNYVYVARKTAS